MAVNDGWDRTNPHDQVSSKPGATPAGQVAASTSVLGTGGWRDPNPWLGAPFHLAQVLAPDLLTTGYGEEAGWMCLTTISKPRRKLDLRAVYTYPGPGSTNVPFSEQAAELNSFGSPHTPGDEVGLTAGGITGPHIMVLRNGGFYESSTLDNAELIGPTGPVSIAIASGLFIIPRSPLAPSTTYTARAAVRFAAHECRQQGLPARDDELICPASYGTYCVTPNPNFPPPPGTPVCGPGQTQPTTPPTLPEEVVVREWQFTTAAGHAVAPRPPVLARTRVRFRAKLAGRRITLAVPGNEAGRLATLRVTRRAPRCRGCRPYRGAVSRRITLRAPLTSLRLPVVRRGGSWNVVVALRRTATHESITLRRTYRR
jgi:hypothetical protein